MRAEFRMWNDAGYSGEKQAGVDANKTQSIKHMDVPMAVFDSGRLPGYLMDDHAAFKINPHLTDIWKFLPEIDGIMMNGKKVVVVMPAYNAAKTLQQTHAEVIAQNVADLIVVVDDASHDATIAIAKTLPNVMVCVHASNRGYGANQKTCYQMALESGADIVVMIHPDYQYTPKLLPAMVSLVANGLYPCVIGSRILGRNAVRLGMPRWKYIANRLLTLIENALLGAKLSEYHTGYRAFSTKLLRRLPLVHNSDDFVFDNQILAEILWLGATIGEVSCPAHYFPEASSINFRRSVTYGFGCLATALTYRLAKAGLKKSRLFTKNEENPC